MQLGVFQPFPDTGAYQWWPLASTLATQALGLLVGSSARDKQRVVTEQRPCSGACPCQPLWDHWLIAEMQPGHSQVRAPCHSALTPEPLWEGTVGLKAAKTRAVATHHPVGVQ